MQKPLLINALHLIPPEIAHDFALAALQHGWVPARKAVLSEKLHTQIAGLDLANPVGLAAGFDKNGDTLKHLGDQGFGFAECGTVTPRAQPGNPKPRIFRLKHDQAVINRLGFNNKGMEYAAARLSAGAPIPVGANIGKNKDSSDAVADYVAAATRLYPLANYLTVNISSPNTPGLRDLQDADAFKALVKAVAQVRDRLMDTGLPHKPIFIKLAPDLDEDAFKQLTDLTLALPADGLILSNTTLSRPVASDEAGGLSGAPLAQLALQALRTVSQHCGGELPLIAAGGISSPEDAYARIRAGASAIQIYTAFIYQGFDLVTRINTGLLRLLQRDGFATLTEAKWADR